MEKHKKVMMFLVVLSFIICSEILTIEVFSSCNGPNYWDVYYPGNIISDNYYRNPVKPENYVFKGIPDPNSNGYDGSHYGTHDWLADAALRCLRDPLKNPLGYDDWSWLLNHDYSQRRNPQWQFSYAKPTGAHYVIRSYITFLFATQMPDMRDPNIQVIEIPQEGTIIGDFKDGKYKKWVGQIQQHKYTFIPTINPKTRLYEFIQQYTLSATQADQLGAEATKAIWHKEKDEGGNQVPAMQPETAAGWLGAMTHYFGDVCLPPHVLVATPEVYGGARYHNWYEKNLGALTLWNIGPDVSYFNYSLVNLINPIPPSIAINWLAHKTIELAYRRSGNHQIELYEPKSGMYISDNSEIGMWSWKSNLDNGGRIGGNVSHFYDKVETILEWAVYYTACAMQYCYSEGKKENNDDPDPNYYVKNPRDYIEQPPSTDPTSDRDDISHSGTEERYSSKIAKKFNNISKLISTIVLIGIPYALQKTLSLRN